MKKKLTIAHLLKVAALFFEPSNPPLKIRDNVILAGIHSETALALALTAVIYIINGERWEVTSVVDGRHGAASLHYSGDALDLATKEITDDETKQRIFQQIKDALGRDYDVILEDLGHPNEHLHIEYQPKRR